MTEEDKQLKVLGHTLRNIRLSKKMSVNTAKNRSNVFDLPEIEDGKDVDLHIIIRLCEFYNVTTDHLFKIVDKILSTRSRTCDDEE